MKSFTARWTPLAILLVALPGAGSSRRKLPPDPKFVAIEQIVILPVVDSRAGKKERIDLDRWLRKTARKELLRKNYHVSLADTTGKAGAIADEDLADAKPDWVKSLGPPDSRWVMVVGVSDVRSKTTFGSTGNAEVFGVLYDKEHGSALWDGKGVGQVGQGGLLGMAMKGAMSPSAIQIATTNLLRSMPKVPKRRD